MIKKIFPFLFFVIISFVFFKPLFLENKLPIPADTIVGLYYPFRDIYSKTNPNGIPFKNFLITDPVRQTFPWRNLSVLEFKKFQLPIWNPYNFAGTPLLANFQSAVFYPLNLIFLVLPFDISWSLLIFLEPILAGIFLYFYLENLKLKRTASILGAIAFSFSGFFVAWLEWGTVVNTALWLPLVLLATDKIFDKKNNLIWILIFILSLVSSFFAGHLQIFFYIGFFSLAYFAVRWYQKDKSLKILGIFALNYLIFIILTFPQLLPTLKFIEQSARNADLTGFSQPGWFIPWQNLIQFVVPDFFGNPSTLNYFGIWNYAEFVGYIGILPLVMAIYALIFRKDRKTLFFAVAFFVSLIFALPNIISEIPFKLQLPLISTSQPTRLIFIADFALSVLAAFGMDYFIRSKDKKSILFPVGFLASFFAVIWMFTFLFQKNAVSEQNILLPTVLFILSAILLGVLIIFKSKNKLFKYVLYLLVILSILDLFRFGWKFESFSDKKYLFPDTSVTSYLKSQKEPFRVISSDATIFPPNFSIMYKIQTLDGYDPLYLRRFGELMAAVGRGKPDISTPFGFNRIITPEGISSPIMDLLNVKYILSTRDLTDTKLSEVFSDGNTKIYLNNLYFERAFFVEKTLIEDSKQEAINDLFNIDYPLKRTATVEEVTDKSVFSPTWRIGKVSLVKYGENKVLLRSENEGEGFLVLADAYYPTWHAKIDGKETLIYITDYAFRGIIVPKGIHTIEFYNTLF